MLILAEGTVHSAVDEEERASMLAWLGPMVDDGFLINGYLDPAITRLIMVLSSPTLRAAKERLDDLPPVQDGSVTFTTTVVTAMRFR